MREKLTYANVVATLALFLALSGGAVYAASKIHSNDIAKKAVKSRNIAKGAVKRTKIANGAVNSAKVADGSLTSSDLTEGARILASPQAGALPIPSGAFSLSPATWAQSAGESALVLAEAKATIAAEAASTCVANVNFAIDGAPAVGALTFTTVSNTPVQQTSSVMLGALLVGSAEHSISGVSVLDPVNCTAGSQIDFVRVRVVGLR